MPGLTWDGILSAVGTKPAEESIMKIAVARIMAAGLKEAVKGFLSRRGIEVLDLGAYTPQASDYPDYAIAVAEAVLEGKADRGMLLCTTANGMAMAPIVFPAYAPRSA